MFAIWMRHRKQPPVQYMDRVEEVYDHSDSKLGARGQYGAFLGACSQAARHERGGQLPSVSVALKLCFKSHAGWQITERARNFTQVRPGFTPVGAGKGLSFHLLWG